MTKPLYKHDCEECIFLGMSENKMYDLYVHNTVHQQTIIARYGDYEGDYKSGLIFKETDPDLKQAYTLAKTRDLIK